LNLNYLIKITINNILWNGKNFSGCDHVIVPQEVLLVKETAKQNENQDSTCKKISCIAMLKEAQNI
jgi:hypothetical protein